MNILGSDETVRIHRIVSDFAVRQYDKYLFHISHPSESSVCACVYVSLILHTILYLM